jgi:predicted methyltransferase
MAGACVLGLGLIAAPAFAQTPAPSHDVAIDTAIERAFAAPDRGLQAHMADESRETAVILRMSGAKPGMRVLDIGSGSGYLALLLSSLVGETGHVDIHNTPGWLVQFPSMEPEVMQARIKRTNIGYIVERWEDIPATPDSYDVITLGQVYHDVILEGGDVFEMNRRIFTMLKPGGRVVIEDHNALASMPIAQQAYLHRILEDAVVAHMLAAGFVRLETHEIESKYDDRRFNVFTPGVRGRTDRFMVSFEKPQPAN